MNVGKGIIYTIAGLTLAGSVAPSAALAASQEGPFQVQVKTKETAPEKSEKKAEEKTVPAQEEKTAPKQTFSLDDLRNMASSGIDAAQQLYNVAKREYQHRSNLTMYVDPIFGLSVIDAQTCQIDRMGDQDLARSLVDKGLLSYTSELVAMDECKAEAQANKAKARSAKHSKAKPAPVACSVHVETLDLDATVASLAGEGAKVVRFAEGDDYKTIMDNVSAFYQAFSSDAKATEFFGKGPKVLGQNYLDALVTAYNAFGTDAQPDNAGQAKLFHDALKVVYEDMGNFMRYQKGAVVVASEAEGKVGYDASKTSDYRKPTAVEKLVTGKAALVAFNPDVFAKFCWVMDQAAEEGTPEVKTAEGTPEVKTAEGTPEVKTAEITPEVKTEERVPVAPTMITSNKGYSSRGTFGIEYMRLVAMGAADGNIVMPYLEGRVYKGLELGIGIPILMRSAHTASDLEGATVPNPLSPTGATTSTYNNVRIGDGAVAGAFDGIGLQLRASYKLGRVVDLGIGVMALYEQMQRYNLTQMGLSDGTVMESERTSMSDVNAFYLIPTARGEFHLFPRSTNGNMGLVFEAGPAIPLNIPHAVMDQLGIPNVGAVGGVALQYTWGATQTTTTRK